MDNEACLHCKNAVVELTNEGLQCTSCNKLAHLDCLQIQSLPGSFHGDVFFEYTCQYCSNTESDIVNRTRMSWFQVITLVMYHLSKKSSGLARKGYFHWKIHISAFINKNWDALFGKQCKRGKKWTGTIPGILSMCSPHFFTSGKHVFNEMGWWTLTYQNITPYVASKLYSELVPIKQKYKELGRPVNISEILKELLEAKDYKPEYLVTMSVNNVANSPEHDNENVIIDIKKELEDTELQTKLFKNKKHLLPSIESICERPKRLHKEFILKDNTSAQLENSSTPNYVDADERKMIVKNEQKFKYLDPFCYYNTSLTNLSILNGIQLRVKLMGNLREAPILSPYSNVYLKPYIRRDCETMPDWLQLMAQVQIKANEKTPGWSLPNRAPIDYTYVQPEHIPAINSLCNQFFWPGIDLTECLQYPDFSCVVMYRKLIVGFAFVVPDVTFHENYLSFIFTRPGWRNCGIARFMIYHLIQMSMGKDITLHVSINNSALFLYQKFGFKVENVILDFYDKYMRRDTGESKHAFFCRLER